MLKNILPVLIALLVLPSLVSADNYYVDNQASPGGDGFSWNTAWDSFSDIDWGLVGAGDVVYISGGSNTKTYNERLTIQGSGQPGNPITIRPGQVSGHNGVVTITNSNGHGIYMSGRSHVVIDGNFGGSQHIRVTGCSDDGVWVQGDIQGVIITYLEVDHNGNANNEDGIQIQSVDTSGQGVVEVSYCLVHDNYQDQINEVPGSFLGNQMLGRIWIHHNTIYNCHDDGMELSGRGMDVYDNIVHTIIGPIRGHPDGIAVNHDHTRIFNNEVYNWDFTSNDGVNAAIYPNPLTRGPGWQCQHIYVYNNLMHNVYNEASPSYPRGIELSAQEVGGTWSGISDIYIANNVIVGFKHIGLSLYTAYTSNVQDYYILNNIVHNCGGVALNYGSSSGTWTDGSWGDGADITIDNNIFSAGSKGGTSVVKQYSSWINYDTWKAGSGCQQGISGNPDPMLDGNYKPMEGSPAINNGLDLSSFTSQAVFNNLDRVGVSRPQGLGWDIGAFEFSTGPQCGAPSGTCHYVDNQASPGGDGSSWSNAWDSFSDINWGAVNPGDYIYISGGPQGASKTYAETLTVSKSGSSGNPLTIRPGQDPAHSGTVIIDRVDRSTNGIAISGNHVTIDGSDAQNNRKIRIQNAYQAVYAQAQDNIKVRYIETDNTQAPNGWSAIRLTQCTNSIIEHCKMRNAHAGCITMSGYGADWGTKVVRYNDCENTEVDGIAGGSGTDIYGNKVVYVGTSTSSHPDGIVVGGSKNRIYLNEIIGYNQPLYVDNFNVPSGIEVKIWGNLIYWAPVGLGINDFRGLVIHPEPHPITAHIFSNTVMDGYIRVQPNSGGSAYIKNNIADEGIRIDDGNMVNLEIDSNWYPLSGPPAFYYDGQAYSTFDGFRSAIQVDWHSSEVSSTTGIVGFQDEVNDDFRLAPGSPAIDWANSVDLGPEYSLAWSGGSWPGITTTTRPQGSRWDPGAFEFAGSLPPDTCQSLGFDCCASCQPGTESQAYDDDCPGTEVCCGTCQGSPTYPGPGDLVEAEDGQLTSPMVIANDPGASGGQYVYSGTTDQGQASYTFQIDQPGSFRLEARINSRGNGGYNSFFVGLVNENPANNDEYAWDTTEGSTWEWDVVSLRGPGGDWQSADFDPKIWQLGRGLHTFVFGGRESFSWLDQLKLVRHCHRADTITPDCCITQAEIIFFIGDWKQGLGSITMTELMDGIMLYNTGQGCP
jgi:hypothetical protein